MFVLFLALGVISTSCNKDDDGGSSSSNSFTVDGNTYDLSRAYKTAFNYPNPDGSDDIDVYLTTSDITAGNGELNGTGNALYLDLNSSTTPDLATGTYTFATDRAAFVLSDGTSAGVNVDVYTGAGDQVFVVNGGSVEVSKDGDETRFEFNLTTTDGNTITGSYQGTLTDF